VIWDETQLPYCQPCLAALQDEGDLDISDAAFDLDAVERHLTMPKQPKG
jgi:hypothetical protein